jgi:hypothetical protein
VRAMNASVARERSNGPAPRSTTSRPSLRYDLPSVEVPREVELGPEEKLSSVLGSIEATRAEFRQNLRARSGALKVNHELPLTCALDGSRISHHSCWLCREKGPGKPLTPRDDHGEMTSDLPHAQGLMRPDATVQSLSHVEMMARENLREGIPVHVMDG